MQVVDISEHEEKIVLYFGCERTKINPYTLVSTLVFIADAIKEANAIINPGYEIEILVEVNPSARGRQRGPVDVATIHALNDQGAKKK